MSQQHGGERHHGHREKKHEVDPREVAVAAGQVSQLRPLSQPEDAERHEAHGVDEDVGSEGSQGVPELCIGADRLANLAHREAQHQEGHADREDPVRDA